VPKLSPLIVTVPLPLGTAFADTELTTGAAENGSAHTPKQERREMKLPEYRRS
jgi:hypothetical protein